MFTWVDAIILVASTAVILFEIRQEVGRGLFDLVATVMAAALAELLAVPLTLLSGWPGLEPRGINPVMHGLTFAFLWLGLLAGSRTLHKFTRWSMERFDFCFNALFAIAIIITSGHILTDLAARTAHMQTGRVPEALTASVLGEELRGFRTYNRVLELVRRGQSAWKG